MIGNVWVSAHEKQISQPRREKAAGNMPTDGREPEPRRPHCERAQQRLART